MGKFIVELTEKAKSDLAKHKKSGNKVVEKKIKTFLEELKKNTLIPVPASLNNLNMIYRVIGSEELTGKTG